MAIIIDAPESRFPHSLGLLYSAFTAYCGFEVNEGEYKLMGLAPYGDPKYVDLIFDKILINKIHGSQILKETASRPNHISYRKDHFNGFVQNSLGCDMGMIIFYLPGGC